MLSPRQKKILSRSLAFTLGAGMLAAGSSLQAFAGDVGSPNPSSVQAEKKITINGIVTDTQGNPLPGVTIFIKSMKIGASTDLDGRYTLSIPRPGTYTLQFSYVGMSTAERQIHARSNTTVPTVQLSEDHTVLNEVIVTGYGNIKKGAYTGSASALNADKQKDLPVVSLTQMMEGQLSGVTMLNSSGMPGANTSMSIRGFGSITASNEPLYVLDGVPVQSGDMSADVMNNGGGFGLLNTLNPADIENITILKDAASASLYGARGANGVVLITTKKGKTGKTSYTARASYGITNFATDFRPTMSGDERRALILEGLVNRNLDRGQTVEWAEENAEAELNRYAAIPQGGYADWMDALFRIARQQSYDLSINGGNTETHFAGSIGYLNHESVAKYSGLERFSGNMNFDNRYKGFDVQFNSMFSVTKEKPLPGGTYYSNPMFVAKGNVSPSTPIKNPDGSYNTSMTWNGNLNPVYENEINVYDAMIARTFTSGQIGYTFIPGLRASTLFNVDYTHTRDMKVFSPLSSDGLSTNGRGDIYSIDNLTWNSQTRINYNKEFGENAIDLLGAYEVKNWDKEYISGAVQNYATSKKPTLGNASEPTGVGHYLNSDAMVSWVFRGNYDYAKKYYLSASFRRDGSSRLDPKHRWDNFWSVSGAWRFGEEEFMKSTRSWLDEGKLRASYGVNGNIPTTLYSYFGLYSLDYGYNDKPGMVETNLANPTLSWEKNYATNIGVDLQLFNRVNVTFDWYTRTTRDLLLSKLVDPITGFGSITDNVGSVHNTGFELEVAATLIENKNFRWTSSLNMSHNRNRVLKLADVKQYTSNSFYLVKEGHSLGTLYLREYAGVNPENGMPQYYSNQPDANGNPSRELVYDPSKAAPVIMGDIYPTLAGGWNNTFRYRWFDLSMNITYTLGGKSYDNGMWSIQDDGYNMYQPRSIELRRRWQQPGDITDVPRYVAGQQWGGWWNSSRGIHSTDHLRLKSLVFGFNFPKEWVNAAKLASTRLYFSGTNLLTWAAYDQYDPELQGTVRFDIPPLKTLSVGLEVGF